MDTAQAALCPVAAMEATLCASAQFEATGTDGGAGVALGVQSTRPVVERGREPQSWFDHLGLVSLLDTVQRLQRTS